MLAKKSAVVVLCLHLVCAPFLSASLAAPSYQPAEFPGGVGELDLSPDTEEFRQQLLDFMAEVEGALLLALGHPVIGPQLQEALVGLAVAVPFPGSMYETILQATPEDLDQVRLALQNAPGVMATPEVLRESLTAMPGASWSVTAAAAGCSDEYSEFQKIVALTNVVRALTTASDSLAIAYSIGATAWRIVNAIASTCESPIDIPTSSVQVPLIVLVFALKIAKQAIDLARDIVDNDIYLSGRCIDRCVAQGFSEHFFPDTNASLVGKGCDNRDNNCAGGIDELIEDRIAPAISIDDSLAERCFRSPAEAQTAVDLAVHTRDDCSTVSPTVTFSPLPQICSGFLSVVASDETGNTASAPAGGALELTIDDTPPRIVTPPMSACYATLEAARDAFAAGQIVDCTAVDSSIQVIENECVAELEIHATDACGNRSSEMTTVRVDGTPPEVRIDELLIPTVDGLACLSSEAEAIESVRNATRFSDNCTVPADLALDTQASGNLCDLTVTSTVTAQDVCGGVTSDSYNVRVDTQPPAVSCTVQKQILWPANEQLVDVGLSYSATDNCGPAPAVEFLITSDEPTAYAFRINGDKDPTPDAVIERDAAGNVQRVLLRAQRKDNGSYDGRVYRIRIVATDRCGLSSQADCFVTVPQVYSQGTGQVRNNGQIFDATVVD